MIWHRIFACPVPTFAAGSNGRRGIRLSIIWTRWGFSTLVSFCAVPGCRSPKSVFKPALQTFIASIGCLKNAWQWLLHRFAACPLRLEQLTVGNDPKQVFLDGIQAQIACRPQDYFDNASLLAVQQFDPRRFYCTPRGVVLYYQQYEIAPYSSGIPEFFFPYSAGILELCQLFREA